MLRLREIEQRSGVIGVFVAFHWHGVEVSQHDILRGGASHAATGSGGSSV